MSSLNPLPQSLRTECNKAAKILREFTIPSSKSGADKLIPSSILATCRGIAIITVVKAGFLFTMRAGSGLVIARLENGDWSAPSCVGLGGMGGGLEIGGEITNFVIILNSMRAVQAFSKGGNLTLGGGMSVAAGPVGRSVEADVTIRSTAAIYTYSKSRGLFAGISIDGSVLLERKGANRKIYGEDVRARDLLAGRYPPPVEAANLYRALDETTGGVAGKFLHGAMSLTTQRRNSLSLGQSSRNSYHESDSHSRGSSSSSGKGRASSVRHAGSSAMSKLSSFGKATKKSISRSVSRKKSSQHGYHDDKDEGGSEMGERLRNAPELKFESGFFAQTSRVTARVEAQDNDPLVKLRRKREEKERQKQQEKYPTESDWAKRATCTALFDFSGEMECDLSFKKGASIEIITRTETQDDWWEGEIHGVVGIFPANFVKLD